MTAPPPRIVRLVVDEPRGVLPPFEVASPWWMESGPVVAAAKLRFGIDVTILRLLDGERFPGGPVSYLVEAPGVDTALLEPWPMAVLPDSRRAHYAEPGAVGELIQWVDGVLADRGTRRSGAVEQVRSWNLSCLLRVPVVDGSTVWLKAVPDFFAHEPAVLGALAEIDPTLVPEVVATRPGATLMAEAGERDGYGVGPDRLLAAVQRFVVARHRIADEALATVPSVGADDVEVALLDLVERHGGDLDRRERSALEALASEVQDRWAVAGVGVTLTHGDLHGGNLRLDDSGVDVIIDWGDATLSHPLLDLAVLDSYTPDWGHEVTDRWLELLDLSRDAWVAFRPLAALRPAVVYRRFCDRIEATEQVYHRGDIVPAIRSGLDLMG